MNEKFQVKNLKSIVYCVRYFRRTLTLILKANQRYHFNFYRKSFFEYLTDLSSNQGNYDNSQAKSKHAANPADLFRKCRKNDGPSDKIRKCSFISPAPSNYRRYNRISGYFSFL